MKKSTWVEQFVNMRACRWKESLEAKKDIRDDITAFQKQLIRKIKKKHCSQCTIVDIDYCEQSCSVNDTLNIIKGKVE